MAFDTERSDNSATTSPTNEHSDAVMMDIDQHQPTTIGSEVEVTTSTSLELHSNETFGVAIGRSCSAPADSASLPMIISADVEMADPIQYHSSQQTNSLVVYGALAALSSSIGIASSNIVLPLEPASSDNSSPSLHPADLRSAPLATTGTEETADTTMSDLVTSSKDQPMLSETEIHAQLNDIRDTEEESKSPSGNKMPASPGTTEPLPAAGASEVIIHDKAANEARLPVQYSVSENASLEIRNASNFCTEISPIKSIAPLYNSNILLAPSSNFQPTFKDKANNSEVMGTFASKSVVHEQAAVVVAPCVQDIEMSEVSPLCDSNTPKSEVQDVFEHLPQAQLNTSNISEAAVFLTIKNKDQMKIDSAPIERRQSADTSFGPSTAAASDEKHPDNLETNSSASAIPSPNTVAVRPNVDHAKEKVVIDLLSSDGDEPSAKLPQSSTTKTANATALPGPVSKDGEKASIPVGKTPVTNTSNPQSGSKSRPPQSSANNSQVSSKSVGKHHFGSDHWIVKDIEDLKLREQKIAERKLWLGVAPSVPAQEIDPVRVYGHFTKLHQQIIKGASMSAVKRKAAEEVLAAESVKRQRIAQMISAGEAVTAAQIADSVMKPAPPNPFGPGHLPTCTIRGKGWCECLHKPKEILSSTASTESERDVTKSANETNRQQSAPNVKTSPKQPNMNKNGLKAKASKPKPKRENVFTGDLRRLDGDVVYLIIKHLVDLGGPIRLVKKSTLISKRNNEHLSKCVFSSGTHNVPILTYPQVHVYRPDVINGFEQGQWRTPLKGLPPSKVPGEGPHRRLWCIHPVSKKETRIDVAPSVLNLRLVSRAFGSSIGELFFRTNEFTFGDNYTMYADLNQMYNRNWAAFLQRVTFKFTSMKTEDNLANLDRLLPNATHFNIIFFQGKGKHVVINQNILMQSNHPKELDRVGGFWKGPTRLAKGIDDLINGLRKVKTLKQVHTTGEDVGLVLHAYSDDPTPAVVSINHYSAFGPYLQEQLFKKEEYKSDKQLSEEAKQKAIDDKREAAAKAKAEAEKKKATAQKRAEKSKASRDKKHKADEAEQRKFQAKVDEMQIVYDEAVGRVKELSKLVKAFPSLDLMPLRKQAADRVSRLKKALESGTIMRDHLEDIRRTARSTVEAAGPDRIVSLKQRFPWIFRS